MTAPTKQMCDGCPRIFNKSSLVKWKDEYFCRNCRSKIESWKIMYIGGKMTEEEIKEMERRR